jgi:hypothetical protein
MPPIPVGRAVLQKVVVKFGGLYAAAAQLAVQPVVVSSYLDGTAPVPDHVLLRAVDIVLDESRQATGRRACP